MNMVEVMLGDLEDWALGWAVAQVLGIEVKLSPPHNGTYWRVALVSTGHSFRPWTDWNQGGPLMDKYAKGYGIVMGSEPPRFRVFAHDDGPVGFCRIAGGATILQAFCRALVRLHRGDVVLVPEVLVQPVEVAANAVRPV
ncbi:phage protein NinX family protein [Pseudomonas sp. TWP3-2]|uniref:phage protein NinX family protein n=1 Tax=Pseudomonas sp. TWP3-2 TaxID=2804574 RepID=UPI003CEBF94A